MRREVVVALVSALLCGCAAAGPAPATPESVIRALDDEVRRAALSRDVAALERLWSEELTVNAPDNRVVVGRRAVLDDYLRAGVIDFARFDRDIEYIKVDGDFAVVMGLETVVPNADAPGSGLVAGQVIRRRVTNIWRREGDTWRLYWRHANVIPAS